MLTHFLDGLAPEEARRQSRVAVDSGNRTYSFTKGPKLASVDAIAWTSTVADVRLDTADHYCADVRVWAESIVRDSEHLMRTVSDDAVREDVSRNRPAMRGDGTTRRGGRSGRA